MSDDYENSSSDNSTDGVICFTKRAFASKPEKGSTINDGGNSSDSMDWKKRKKQRTRSGRNWNNFTEHKNIEAKITIIDDDSNLNPISINNEKLSDDTVKKTQHRQKSQVSMCNFLNIKNKSISKGRCRQNVGFSKGW